MSRNLWISYEFHSNFIRILFESFELSRQFSELIKINQNPICLPFQIRKDAFLVTSFEAEQIGALREPMGGSLCEFRGGTWPFYSNA